MGMGLRDAIGGVDCRVAVDTPIYFAMKFVPSPDLINSVRRFVQTFFKSALGASEQCSRVALATHELLENAVHHCIGGEATLRVAVAPLGNDVLVTVRTRNEATATNIRRLRETVERLSDAPPEAYLAFLRQSAEETGSLGLARVRIEARMDLLCEVLGNEVELRAQARLSPR